jgi:Arc/MetJ-type ribon-helix-helix transcriptional regulator
MKRYIHARLLQGQDDDLTEWLGAQPQGTRSEAIRSLLRDGLRMRQIDTQLPRLVRQAVEEALSNVQIRPTQRDASDEEIDIEEQYGGQLDDLLSGFG